MSHAVINLMLNIIIGKKGQPFVVLSFYAFKVRFKTATSFLK